MKYSGRISNYHSTARTNYFKAKSVEALKEWALPINLQVWEKYGKTALKSNLEGGWPQYREISRTAFESIDFFQELQEHLQQGEVVIAQKIGQDEFDRLDAEIISVSSEGVKQEFSFDSTLVNTGLWKHWLD